MSYTADSYFAPRAAVRPTTLIALVAVLEVLTFSLSDYSAAGGWGAAFPWMLLSAYLLRKIWRGSYNAWWALVMLNVCVIVLAALTLFAPNTHLTGGPLVVVRVGLELALLAAPSMRRWVAQD